MGRSHRQVLGKSALNQARKINPRGPVSSRLCRRPGTVRAQDGSAQISENPSSCGLCSPPDSLPQHLLGEAGIDSIGRKLSGYNLRCWRDADRLYRAGAFGPVGNDKARAAARLHFALRCWNGFDYVAQVTQDKHRVDLTREQDLETPFGRIYCNTTVYPLRFLSRALVDPGGFCMQYTPPDRFDEMSMLGGVPIRVHSDRIDPGSGPPASALSVDFESTIHKTVELVYEPNVCGRVSQEMVVDRGDTLDLICIYDLEGMYVRKFGVHRMGAMVFWRSHVEGSRDPGRPRLGASAYFPHIHLNLPAFLPSIGLADLRDFDVPQPVLTMSWFVQQAKEQADWITAYPDGMVGPWDPVGPRPRVLDQRFPDL